MNHQDHVALLKPGIGKNDGSWADFGCGEGAFTLALAELLEPGTVIHAIDKNRQALERLARRARRDFPAADIRTSQGDFTMRLPLPQLEGIVMANSLHFYRDKEPILRGVLERLRPGGRLIMVEYDSDRGNRWVPYPLSLQQWQVLADSVGLVQTRRIGSRSSSFLGSIYSALSLRRATNDPREA